MTSGTCPRLCSGAVSASSTCDARGVGLVDVDLLQARRGGVEQLEVERRLAARGERVLDPDAVGS